jgi:hypothetical protein
MSKMKDNGTVELVNIMTFNGQENTAFLVTKGSEEISRGQAGLHKTQLLKRFYPVGQKT